MKRYILVAWLWLLPWISTAQSLLWKVSGKNLDAPSYVLGTHHLVAPAFLDSIPGYKEVFSRVKQVVGELDLSKGFQPAMREQCLRVMRLPQDTTLKMLLNKEEYKQVKHLLRNYLGLSRWFYRKMKPVVLMSVVQSKMMQEGNTSYSSKGLDWFIFQQARLRGLTCVGLENMIEQMRMLVNSSTLQEQAGQLALLAKDPPCKSPPEDKLLSIYRQANLEEIEKFIINSVTVENRIRMMDKRNDLWMEKLPDLMGEKNSLIVVGIGHLVGENGLICQLRKRGYKVEPVLP